MNSAMWGLIAYALNGVALLMAAAPWLAGRASPVSARELRNLRNLRIAAIVLVLVVLASLLEWSLAFHGLNLALCGAALLCALKLALFCVRAQPRWLWLPTSVLGLFGVGIYTLGGAVSVAFEGRAIEVAAAEGRVCRWSMYGFVTGDSGNVLEVYRRHGVIDVPLARVVRSDVSPEDNVPPPAGLQATVDECDRKVNAVLRAG